MSEHIKDDVITAEKREIVLSEETDILCPDCGGKAGQKYYLRVRSDIDGTANLECANCTHTMNVPSKTVRFK